MSCLRRTIYIHSYQGGNFALIDMLRIYMVYIHISLNHLREPLWEASKNSKENQRIPKKIQEFYRDLKNQFSPNEIIITTLNTFKIIVWKDGECLSSWQGQKRGSNNITFTWFQQYMLIYCIVILGLSSWVPNVTVWSQGSPKLTLQQVMSGDWLVF